jgi:hypothetical protein
VKLYEELLNDNPNPPTNEKIMIAEEIIDEYINPISTNYHYMQYNNDDSVGIKKILQK